MRSRYIIISVVLIIAVIFVVIRFVIGGEEDAWICEGGQWVKHGNPESTKPIEGCGPVKTNEPTEPIGGQKDEHGCLIPAGYSWCETKQKCLRTWEESCDIEKEPEKVVTGEEAVDYINSDLGFALTFPKTWEGYKATQGNYPTSSYVGFSFGGNRQPFTIFQIIKYTKQQWDANPKNVPLKILDQNNEHVFVCDGCCNTIGDFTGGGQFDDFQVARCKEVPEILKTFNIPNLPG